MLETEVEELAGARYARKTEAFRLRRHGSNRGSERLAGQWVPVRVPRVRGEAGEIALSSYRALRERDGAVDERLLRGVLYGLSCRNYERVALEVPGALGLAKSSVSRAFVKASAARLRAFQERDLSGEDFVALFLDGKSFAEDQMVIALGVTMGGEKRLLGFVQSDTESSKVLAPFLRGLLERGSFWSVAWTSRRGSWSSSTEARGCARRWSSPSTGAAGGPSFSAASGTSARTW